jgi:hypothetical protein
VGEEKPLPGPNPADPANKEFAWMTVHEFRPDRAVTYPFKDFDSLIQPQD